MILLSHDDKHLNLNSPESNTIHPTITKQKFNFTCILFFVYLPNHIAISYWNKNNEHHCHCISRSNSPAIIVVIGSLFGLVFFRFQFFLVKRIFCSLFIGVDCCGVSAVVRMESNVFYWEGASCFFFPFFGKNLSERMKRWIATLFWFTYLSDSLFMFIFFSI